MEFKFESVLITGGAGFLGSSLALAIKNLMPKCQVICIDNLIRKEIAEFLKNNSDAIKIASI